MSTFTAARRSFQEKPLDILPLTWDRDHETVKPILRALAGETLTNTPNLDDAPGWPLPA